ncbi:MAG: hypothetical protein RLZZ106_138 [Cyanobacteriota bacterium]
MASNENAIFATQTIAQWARQHGLYEIREVLTVAVQIAAKVRSAEELADALEAAVAGE